jgi:hypothetical protein
MVGTPPMVILLLHGKVLVCVILLFHLGSSSASLPSAKSSLESPIIFIALLSSY